MGETVSLCVPSALSGRRVVRVGPTLHPYSPISWGRRCPQEGISAPATSLSSQCGEGTPQATGFFEVMVGGKLVHSKKVCLSVRPSYLVFSLAESWDPGPSLLLPSSSHPQRGDGYVDTESKFLKLVAAIKAALAQG